MESIVIVLRLKLIHLWQGSPPNTVLEFTIALQVHTVR